MARKEGRGRIRGGGGGLVLLFCVVLGTFLPRPAGFLPVYRDSDGGHEAQGWRKQCVDPEECCLFASNKFKFEECCEDHGCCPLSCPSTREGTNGFVVTENCHRGWECCRFGTRTPDYNVCCSAHGCCPPCEQVSKGCCYSGSFYEPGASLEEFPEACLRLVCAVRASPFSYVVVPVRMREPRCRGEDGEGLCLDNGHRHRCVDDSGLLRAEEDRWSIGECEECRCSEGGTVSCRRLGAECQKQQPEDDFLPISGRMNEDDGEGDYDEYSENSSGIVPRLSRKWRLPGIIGVLFGYKKKKEAQRRHFPCHLKGQEGKEWPTDDPCVVKVCTREGVVERRRRCDAAEAVPPRPDCVEFTPEGECCSRWNCSGCLGEDGTFHAVGDEWGSEGSCNRSVCTEGGIEEAEAECEEVPTPGPNCFEHLQEGECCQQWNCSGCLDDQNEYHPLGDLWQNGSCSLAVCTEGGIMEIGERCDNWPRPGEHCVEVVPEGGCCPEWSCGGCSKGGRHYEIGEESGTEDPCVTLLCTEHGVEMRRRSCGWTRIPSANCFLQREEGECCEKWNCSGCKEGNEFHEMGSSWIETNPCVTSHCTEGGITEEVETCHWTPPPRRNCFQYIPEGECCHKWNCSGCYHGGRHYELGEDFSTKDPCVVFTCTEEGISSSEVSCDWIPPPPLWNCFSDRTEDGCCIFWNCSGCLDDYGAFFPLGHLWKVGDCTTNLCTENGIKGTEEKCDLGPIPHPGCRKVRPTGRCCEEWKCNGCFDREKNFYELGTEMKTEDPCITLRCSEEGLHEEHKSCIWTKKPYPNCFEYKPEGECCNKWNCSGCIDEDGTYYSMFHSTNPDPCITSTCTINGIETSLEYCDPGPAPNPTCVEVKLPGKCCPEWNCNGCIDETGAYRTINEIWNSDPCTTHKCMRDRIKTNHETCETIFLLPGCLQYTPEGECCPKLDCGGCVDISGLHKFGEKWEDPSNPCTEFECDIYGRIIKHSKCRIKDIEDPVSFLYG